MTARKCPPNSGAWMEIIKTHWAFVLILCLAVFPLFADLGGDYLWSDEGDTAVLASSILKNGVPKAWDGRTFSDSDFGARVNKDLVMVSHPWLQYYLTAGSFFVFGENAFAARFPFALAGWLTIPLLYLLVLRLTSDRKAALAACFLLSLSVQFLLFSRQCRNYSLYMFFACGLLLLFFRLNNWKTTLYFAAAGIALFHCHPAGLAPLGALGMLTLCHTACQPYRRWFWRAMPIVAVFTLPWIFWAGAGYQHNTTLLQDGSKLLPRLIQFFIECASVTPAVGVIALFVFVWIRHYRRERKSAQSLAKKNKKSPFRFTWQYGRELSHQLFAPGERTFILMAGFVFLSYGVLLSLTQSRTEMWNYGLRYATPVIPLTMGLIGLLISKACGANWKAWLAIMLVLGVTKLGRITPWSFFDEERTYFDGSVVAAMHVPIGWKNKIFRTALISFARELWHENRGTVAHISAFMQANAAPDDILITNYDWEPVYFHTRLRQGWKIMPHFPIYDAARKHQLPEYVFGVTGVRWIVWRWAWNGYRDYDWDELHRALTENGAILTKVAAVPETTWENRSNIHFHRYPGDDYKFLWYAEEDEPDAEIFRVDWPAPPVP